jgi:phosphopantetheine--protein transferase-like protein
MEAATLLRKTVAEFFEVDEGQVGPSFSLQARQGSIARAALDAAIRGRVGLKSRAVYSAKTFGELADELAPGQAGSIPSPVAPASAPVPIAGTSGASCGVDLELIANLPVAADPWEHDFYRAHFTPSEIAYSLRQPEPPMHFAARWCAKEALKKCDRAFLAVDPAQIEVVLDEAGAPHLEYLGDGRPARLPHAVSLSHTPHAAVAVVVRFQPAPAPTVAPIAPTPAPTVAPIAPPPRRGSALLVVLNLIAIGLAALALTRTYPNLRWPFPG